MDGTTAFYVSITNTGEAYSPNANGINLPQASPSVSDFNRIMSQPPDNSAMHSSTDQSAIFGTHIKEAVSIVKDWVRDGKK